MDRILFHSYYWTYWGELLRNRANHKRIYRLLSDLPASIPTYLAYRVKQDEDLARALATFIRSFGQIEITDSEYFHFATIMHNKGLLIEKDYKSIVSSILHLIYRNFYIYLSNINLRALKEDCSFSSVKEICAEDWPEDISYLLKYHLIDAEEHIFNTCKVFTEGKTINYIKAIRKALVSGKAVENIFRMCLEVTDVDSFSRLINIIENHDPTTLRNMLKMTILDMSIHSTRQKKYKAIEKLASFGNTENEFLIDTSKDPVYSYLKHEILRHLPQLYKSIDSAGPSDQTAKLSILAAFREMPKIDRIHHYKRILRDKDETDSFKGNVLKELQHGSFLSAGKLLLEEHRVSGHTKMVNSALQIWCNKNQLLAAELFTIQKGLHPKSEFIRIIAANTIIGSVKTLLIIMSNAPVHDTEMIYEHLTTSIPSRTMSEQQNLKEFISELIIDINNGIHGKELHVRPKNILEEHQFIDTEKVLDRLENLEGLVQESKG